jgi:hypothetical protein
VEIEVLAVVAPNAIVTAAFIWVAPSKKETVPVAPVGTVAVKVTVWV